MSKTFCAMLARDWHVARRNSIALMLQTLLQPMLLVFVFGNIMTGSGMIAGTYKNILLPGVMAMSMVLTGVQAVAMPLIAEFQFTHEIEDRLLAPMRIGWLAVEKVIAGMLQSLVAGAVVALSAWLLLGASVRLNFGHPLELAVVALLVALAAGAGGLTLGCSVGQTQIGLMFTLVIAPMIFFGCAYYPWASLAPHPFLQKAVLVNPLVYASEGLRGILSPVVVHLPSAAVIGALSLFDFVLLGAGLFRFNRKAIS
jgi:ABC-2 type transport system permease protein